MTLAGATVPPNSGTISGIDGPPINVVNPVVQAPSGADVVRIALLRPSGGRRTPAATARRSTDGARTLRLVLGESSLRALRAGRYRVEVTPGRTRTDTGPTAAAAVTVTT